MPYKIRKGSMTKIYHVMLRGNDKQDIFYDYQDYCKFLKILKIIKEKYHCEIYEYCLMTNHVHMIIFDRQDVLSKVIQSLAISYSLYFAKKYKKEGHLFQGRFLSKSVESREYLCTLCRYIHQNPLKANIAKTEEYQWSSYNEFLFDSKINIINPNPILSMFGQTKKEARKNFIIYHSRKENLINEEVEYEFAYKLKDEQVKEKIQQILKIENVRLFRMYDKDTRDAKLKELKIIKGASKAQISRVLGINKKMVERIMKS